MGVTNFPYGINVGDSTGGSADFTIGGTTVTLSAAALNRLVGSDASGKEIADVSGTVIAGTASVVSGLSTVDSVVGSLTTINGTAAGQARVVATGTANVAAGRVAVRVEDATGSTCSGTVTLLAYGDV